MRRAFLISIMIIAFSSFVFAAPVGNIASPVMEEGVYGIKIGAEADFVTERELDVSDESVELETNFYSAKISYTLMDRVDVYALLGTINDAEVTEKTGSSIYKYFFDDGFAWGLGATLLIHEFDNGLRIGMDGKYRTAEVDLTAIDIDGTRYDVSSTSNIAGEFAEWQIALGITREFGETVKFIPYAGVKYSDVEVQAEGTVSGTTYKTDKLGSKEVVGIFAGAAFCLKDALTLNLEGRFIDETAFSVGLSYKF